MSSQEVSLNWKGLNAPASSHPDPRYLCSSPNKMFQNQNQTPRVAKVLRDGHCHEAVMW